ncbi:MAG: leucyl aminopeptidase [Pseudomonadota bacterium]|uniref:leucyl aminopeptidase n=1 Tax=Roseovarius TaxID=74030 RepID=UPI0022A7A847|nr:leucyl aminopeptidase [Roseovarius sp. EGI FJ00037]MCZ0811066.1 leucyl aminopeptidase [Roseovarius sp. EGI FJ00037]
MTTPVAVNFEETDIERIGGSAGRVAVIVTPDGKLDSGARRVNRLCKGALKRLVESDSWGKVAQGELRTLAWPAGMEAEAIDVLCLERNASTETARRGGVALAKAAAAGGGAILVLAGSLRRPAELALGLALRSYRFGAHKRPDDPKEQRDDITVTMMVSKPAEAQEAFAPKAAIAEGVFFTRDLISEPANHLTTTEFADRISAMENLGLKITILEESDMSELGMGALLSVGHGSASPSKLAVMEWKGGAKGQAPLALVGKGVVFDTGGISLKPAAGMEDMTMDMGGAGVVCGTMRALALRKARANVVGLVGLVENMPSDRATRPGDVVTSMKGDTIEVINTDAEGRMVLADVLWYAQERFNPAGIVDLATLTGAMIIALGNEKAGVFSNDDALCDAFLKAAETEGEGAWRMPLAKAYDDLLKSDIADMKNVGGRAAGSITAAQFLKRFVRDEVPWIHLDIAGVTLLKTDAPHAPKGASGWGVMALDRLVADMFEQG